MRTLAEISYILQVLGVERHCLGTNAPVYNTSTTIPDLISLHPSSHSQYHVSHNVGLLDNIHGQSRIPAFRATHPLRIDAPERVSSPELTGERNRFPIRLELIRTQAHIATVGAAVFYHLFTYFSLTFIPNYDFQILHFSSKCTITLGSRGSARTRWRSLSAPQTYNCTASGGKLIFLSDHNSSYWFQPQIPPRPGYSLQLYYTEYGKSFDYNDQGKGRRWGSNCWWKGGSGVYTGVTIFGKTGGRDLLR